MSVPALLQLLELLSLCPAPPLTPPLALVLLPSVPHPLFLLLMRLLMIFAPPLIMLGPTVPASPANVPSASVNAILKQPGFPGFLLSFYILVSPGTLYSGMGLVVLLDTLIAPKNCGSSCTIRVRAISALPSFSQSWLKVGALS